MMAPSRRGDLLRAAGAACLLLLAAIAQLTMGVRGDWLTPGEPWFLFGTDTVYHDAVVHLWVARWWEAQPGVIPLWMPELHGGLPTLGAFLWTPLAPPAWSFLALDYPTAQRVAWVLALWIGGCGALLLARSHRLGWSAALTVALGWELCGHVVTLIHAGHFQKVMALGWLPWAAAGMTLALRRAPRARAAGVAAGALGVAMTLLSGHPQIAYAALAVIGARAAWEVASRPALWRAPRRIAPVAFAAVAIGGLGILGGGAQLLPGVEMSAASNRAGGVTFEEATETSYPPGELAELVVPRVKGSSVRGDEYHGEWGERIVSDYAGRLVVLLALAVIMSPARRRRVVLFWVACLLVSLLVGVGKHTPLYGVLHRFLPGFASFRSPGTFMCVAALAIPMLAGFGVEALLRQAARRRLLPRRAARALAVAAALLAALDLGAANRHFLIAEPWEQFRRAIALPTDGEARMIALGLAEEYIDPLRPLSLRPILWGGRVPQGYHPITFAGESPAPLTATGLSTAYLERFGAAVLPILEPAIPGYSPVPGAPVMTTDDPRRQFLTADGGEPDWEVRAPNVRVLGGLAGARELLIKENAFSGWSAQGGGGVLHAWQSFTPEIRLRLDGATEAVTLRYEPFAWRAGLFLTALGAGILAFLAMVGALRRR